MSASRNPKPERRFALEPYSYAAAEEISRELGLAEPVAAVLVRRGLTSVEAAREFLAADEAHDPFMFEGMEEAVAAVSAAIEAGKRITVHGDYDVDGTTSTAILISALRDLGAECDWLIPSRVEDGYGITPATIDRLAERGTGLLLTADCGITSVGEVASARSRGIDVVVTDHHQPAAELPDCPIVHPVVSGYPCPDLCAAGVAFKVAGALLGEERAERDLDLVALATLADMVPLRGENRTLVRRGLEASRRSPRLGLRALMEVAGCTPERLSETDCSFRLSPRINAAGRLYRADAAVELFLATDAARAREIAIELDRANLDRRETESDVLADANRCVTELTDEQAAAPAIVVWHEGWHPGVVGICASRMAERHGKPSILISIDENGRGKGSGRSIPGFDLLGALRACDGLLARYGGHRAAAGVEIEAENLDAFRAAFSAHVASVLGDDLPERIDKVDAVVGAESLNHDVAAQLASIGPFGQGNPEVRLVVPSAGIADVRPMGEEGRHARFSLRSGGARTGGVAFGVGSTLEAAAAVESHDVTLRLELNEWNGAVEPRVVLDRLYEPSLGHAPVASATSEGFARRFTAELERAPGLPELPVELGLARERVDRRGASGVAAVASLASTGEPVLVLCADALWRRPLVDSAADPTRFSQGSRAMVAARAGLDSALADAREVASSGGVALCDWAALGLAPALPREFTHVVLADPAPHERFAAAAASGSGYVHTLTGGDDESLSLRALEDMLPLRQGLAEAFRALRAGAGDGGALDMAAVGEALRGPGGYVRSPEASARIIRILAEMGIVRAGPSGFAEGVQVVSSVRGDVGDSPSFAAHEKAHKECRRFLTERKTLDSKPLRRAA